jgi:hypothetical protein
MGFALTSSPYFTSEEICPQKLEDLRVAPNAHTTSVDSETEEVYLPLKET